MSAKLSRLVKDIRACRLCAEAPDGAPLPHEPRPVLQASKTARLAVFGSVAREEATLLRLGVRQIGLFGSTLRGDDTDTGSASFIWQFN